jgi:hypothetical protein
MDILNFLGFKRKTILQVNWRLGIHFGWCRTFGIVLQKWIRNFSTTMPHPIIPLREMVTYCWTLWFNRLSGFQVWLFLVSWTQITYQKYSTYWITSKLGTFRIPLKKITDWERFQSLASDLISPRLEINTRIEADKAAREFTASIASA